MKKLANLIVRFRYFILAFFIVLAGVSLFLSEQVKVNHDLTAYMPESSETSQGKKIMDDEFSGVETSTLMVMFDDLPEEQKQNVKSDLGKIENVKSVAHDDSADFNKDNHTLYTITVDGAADSKEAAEVFNKVDGTYKEQYELHYSGDVASNNAEVVSIWIIALAIGAAMLILIFLCDSFVEPFLFLFTIGLAVFINAGTNIMFPQISHITKAIAAVLQLALSMDYSIMLMNRYRQEKQAIKARSKADNQRAMKAALAHSFGSISSSSITTVVGLFVLVFMSFTIGRDMGLIMSKGVILSLLTIFTCLPGLILLFDRLITKTTKKHSLNFKMIRAGDFAYKFRKVAPFVFLVILVGSFMLKGNVAITYTGSENDVIGSIFPKTNQIAVVYGNEDESKVAEYCRSYEGKENVKQVLCYGNTINEPEKVTELTAKMADLGKSIDVEDYLLRVVYYHYYNPDETHQMTVSEFVNFVQNDILQNPELKKHISAGSAAQIERLSNFTDLNKLNQPRTISDLASVLEIDEEGVKDLMVLYGAKDPAGALTLEQVFGFIMNDIYGTSYEAELSDTIKTKISAVAPFINKNFINTQMNAAGLARVFGLDEATVSQLLFYNEYNSRTDTDLTMSLVDLLTLIQNDETLSTQLASNTALAALLSNQALVNQLIANIPGEYGYADMAAQISGAIANNVVMLMQAGHTEQAMELMNATSGMAESLPATLKQVYVYRADQIAAATATMSPYEFVSFILAHAEDPALDGTIPSATIATLTELKKVMDAVNAETKFTAAELASFLNANLDSVKTFYSYYNYLYVNNNPTLSLQNTIKFILNEVIPSEKYASRLAPEKQEKVRNVNAVIDSTVNGVLFDHAGLYNLLRPLSATIEPKTIDVAYIYHGSKA
ncbi:MAG: MMPL family transporter, partial [Candidatus Saccharibacteria bacterium]|nr:MMPL family transporter [Candidatus Saccharibacteria bacterium]